jgi:hypothetical protein
MRLRAPRCVTLAAFAIIGADTIGRDKTSSIGRRQAARRAAAVQATGHLLARLRQSGDLLHAALGRGRHRIEKGEKTGQAVWDRRRSLGTAFSPTLKPNRCEATLPRARR